MKLFALAVLWMSGVVSAQAVLTLEAGPSAADSTAPAIRVPPPAPNSSNKATAGSLTTEDVLKFKNGDLLHGQLVSVSPQDGVRWSRKDAKGPLQFDLGNIREIQLGGTTSRRSAVARAAVRLTNGDSLRGEIVALNKEMLKFQTWYAGDLEVRRSMIASLEPSLASVSVLYAGPGGLEEWYQRARGERGWSFRKGALVSAGGSGGVVIGRDVKLPEMASIEFEAAWLGYVNFQVLFYAENFDNYYNSDCYALQVSGSTIFLQRCQRNSGMNNVDQQVNLESLQRRNKARFALKVNKPRRTIALYIDGVLVKQWNDRIEFTGRGTGLAFVSQGQPTRISNIVVAEWDGKLDLDSAGGGKAAEEDLVRLANGDKLSGRLDVIAGGQVRFATSYAKLEIPLERVVEIVLAAKMAEKPRRQIHDLRAHFAEGGFVTVALDWLDAEQLRGNSESLGRASFQRQAFQRMEFNIYDETPEAEEDDEWGAAPSTGVFRRIIRGARDGGILIEGGVLRIE